MRRLLVICALVAVGLAGTALARRPATDAERSAMASAIGFPPACVTAFVSTVDGNWGKVAPTNASGCPMADGFSVVHDKAGTWSQAWAGSDYGACPIDGVPTRVARDLRACRKARAYILCLPRGTSFRKPRAHPRRCTTLGPHDSFAQAMNLTRLRWRGWGRRVARGRGIERGFHLPYSHVRVRLKAYRRRRACGPNGNDYLYTRLRGTSRFGTTVVRFPHDCAD